MTELLSCPFCGCDDETKMEFINSTTWCFQRCTNCGATGPRVCGGHGGDSRKAWDTRVLAAQEEQIDRLTEALERIARETNDWGVRVITRAALEGSKRDG